MAIKNSLPDKDISAVLQAQKMLWEYLCSENLPGGAALKESVLAREFKLHRSAVREALSMATGWGIRIKRNTSP